MKTNIKWDENQNHTYRMLWQKMNNNKARLLRVYGQTPEAFLPSEIEGYPLTEIASYCFAHDRHLPEEEAWEDTWEGRTESEKETLHELSGSYITQIFLPDHIHKIGAYALYNCSQLEVLSAADAIAEIGSDVFMNCRKLNRIQMRCDIHSHTCLRLMLAQLPATVEVTFGEADSISAVVLYPEYYENYDEIAPAHIFGRSISGEGFRARQCFVNEQIDLNQYDEIFEQACVEESIDTLVRMAINRLRYPVDLVCSATERYENYLYAHAGEVCHIWVQTRNEDILRFLCRKHYLNATQITTCILDASKLGWATGAASMMQWKKDYGITEDSGQYEFDDFD